MSPNCISVCIDFLSKWHTRCPLHPYQNVMLDRRVASQFAPRTRHHLTPTIQSLSLRPVRYTLTYHNACELQRLVMNDARNPELKKGLLPSYARAFKEMEELKLRIRMKPAPKPIDTTKIQKPAKHAKSDGPSES